MKNKIEIIGLQGIPLINPGDNIPKIILEAVEHNNIQLKNGDIILIAQTIISKSNGRLRSLKDIKPSEKAISIYNTMTPKARSKNVPIKTPEHIQAILDESKEVLKIEHVLITETKQGFVCANAGIDKSNIEGEDNISLLPENSDLDAKNIKDAIKKTIDKDIAVIITDSFGRPFREGAIGVALGISGINAIIDKRGAYDLFGHELQSTIIGQVDNLASAAQLIMGEADEGIPIVLIRGYEFEFVEDASIKSIIRDKNIDLFRIKESYINLIDILKKRRSYKFEFSSKNVDKNIIMECIEIARWAPSAHNAQFWRYIILDKNNIRSDLINRMNEKLRVDLRNDNRKEAFIEKKIKKTRKQFLQAPYLILSCIDTIDLEEYSDKERIESEFLLGVQSVSSSLTYLLLALEFKGLASCWYCAPLFSKDIVKSTLNLPKKYVPMAFITVGYPLKEPKVPVRRKLSEIIFNI
ncbi:MAG: coenzyme F420-0:L-glutamate ligase [Promethearchaeota archaeon]